MKKSELRQMIREMISEATDPMIDKIGEIAKRVELMSMRKPLERLFKKNDIDFAMSPIPHFRVKYKGKVLIIVNKNYADNAELIVKNLAIGYEGRI